MMTAQAPPPTKPRTILTASMWLKVFIAAPFTTFHRSKTISCMVEASHNPGKRFNQLVRDFPRTDIRIPELETFAQAFNKLPAPLANPDMLTHRPNFFRRRPVFAKLINKLCGFVASHDLSSSITSLDRHKFMPMTALLQVAFSSTGGSLLAKRQPA